MRNDQHSRAAADGVRKAQRLYRSTAQFSMATNIPETMLSRMTNGEYLPSAVHAAEIERATKGQVKRHEIRPDIYRPDGGLRRLPATAADLQCKNPSQRKRAAAKGKPKPARKKVK